MKALVFQGQGSISWTEVPDPQLIDPTDVVVRVDTTTICGTDLHILKGDVPAVTSGRVLGHEAVGVITEVGSAVTSLALGDRVLVPAITSCGKCAPCKTGMPSHCASVGGIGWIFGHLIDGTQAEYVRVPYAETSVHVLPDSVSNEQAIFLADILPTGFEIGVQNGHVQPGDTVVVVGVGPVGLAAIRTAGLYGASTVIAVDLSEARLKRSLNFGADETINSGTEDVRARVLELTGGLGAQVVIEAVGIPATFELCTTLVRPGGHLANVGVHGKPVDLHLEDLWINNITIATGLVNGTTIPTLLDLVAHEKIATDAFGTHSFGLDQMIEAYDVFAHADTHDALKVTITR
ncbi:MULTISPECIES: zinc-binding dehydrogenase [unclassified Rhodococcus (in: high G+C Gram-positive bacteria)]|uniref:zinc-binding dehydrogenase n=1 Tax=unclassified Rhodococcus (in: high G+C Gram-positive bacteria) TaxID=192944 RepID=UPI0016395D79|nr:MULTISPECIES: alcohol dehydrogenase catalytic domain-containing protein [unclassified Rhodococcus (in: high G+C Gram-positive bacteria)]MBC2639897.1 alcohol dehydrogenase catalytic domain-containing protein [Rhodococcus sp. 3A]MBC2895356.1 alcohol dehydrogenase catalytic domain-containing protein [Rhodococcus sp. 4CII]